MSNESLIQKLKNFTPDQGDLDRDALIFAAGQASMRRRWSWPMVIVTSVQVMTVVMLAVLLWPRPGAPVIVAMAPQTGPAPSSTEPPAAKPPDPAVPKPLDPVVSKPSDPVVPKPTDPFVSKGSEPVVPNPPEPVENPGAMPPSIFGRRPRIDFAPMPHILADLAKKQLDVFEVPLLDGRQMTVRSVAEKVDRYNVSTKFLEKQVRKRLTEIFVQYPDKVSVLRNLDIDDPGQDVPFRWVADPNVPEGRVAKSLGEPLDQLAEVEITGEKGPQAAFLERMVNMHWMTWGAVVAEKNMPRTEFEKIFGVVPESQDRIWIYPLAQSKLLVRFEGNPAQAAVIEYLEGTPSESVEGVPLPERGKYYQAVFHIDRDFLFTFLHKRFRHAGPEDMDRLRRYLDDTAPVVKWTEQERKELLSPAS